MIYADTNALARFYIDLPGSSAARTLLKSHADGGGEPLPVTWLLELELINALEQAVHTSRTSGQMRVTSEHAAAAHAFFREDVESAAWLRHAELPMRPFQDRFVDLALRHTAKLGCRAYDLLHVASALVLGCTDFWTFDLKARRLAETVGLRLNSL